MSGAEALEIWMSLSVQVAIVAAVTVWIEPQVASHHRDRTWAMFYLAVLALTAVAWLGPHLRFVNPRILMNSTTIASIAAGEELVAVAVMGLWACGAAVGIVLLGVAMVQAARFIRASRPVDAETQRKLLQSIGKEHEKIDIRVSGAPVSPFCWQFSRGVIVVPRRVLQGDADMARVIVKHELAHLRAGHPLQLFLQRIIEVIFWYHPVVWLAARRAALQRELFADSQAVGSRDEAIHFVKGLLLLAGCGRSAVSLSAGLAFGGASSQIEIRARQLANRGWNQVAPCGGKLPWLKLAALTALCGLLWLPVNVVASTREVWSPWPWWSAAALHEVGLEVRDYEIDSHRLLPHHHPQAEHRH